MSGSSMDGIDLVCCNFSLVNNQWRFDILASETVPYNETWRQRLSQLYKQKADIYPKLDFFYGKYIGKLINEFISKNNLNVDLIASHGHTAFHRPKDGFTAQIGDGAAIQAETGIPVVCNFRTTDVALGGQGAPLVPVGEKFLFSGFDGFLNLGGFANITIMGSNITAFDISPCNIVLNRAARWLKKPYDDGGQIAASAEVDPELLKELNELEYYQKSGPKSLSRDWINMEFWPIVKSYPDTSEQEKLATLTEHISTQIADTLNKYNLNKVLATGGGVFNTHLLNLIKNKTTALIEVPDTTLVNYKEALIFAFLGVLRMLNQNNVLSSVTGSKSDNIGGALYGNFLPLLNKIQ